MWRLLFLAVLLIEGPAHGREFDPLACRANPERVDACRVVRGRMTIANGNPTFRVWIVGTRRIVGVHGPSLGETERLDILPAAVRAALRADPFGTQVFGDYEICPLTRERPGWMQMVCLASASRLAVQRFE